MARVMFIGSSSVGPRACQAATLILAISLNGMAGPLIGAPTTAPTTSPRSTEDADAGKSGARLPPPIEREAPEHQVKAAALHRFPGYVEWPRTAFADADAPIVVGVVGAPEIAEALESMSVERTVEGRALRVLRLSPSAPMPLIHVLFIGQDQREHIPHLLGHVAGQPVLTVTEVPDGLALGSMINFWTDQRVRFEVSLFATENSGLQLSSRLLPIASTVHIEPP